MNSNTIHNLYFKTIINDHLRQPLQSHFHQARQNWLNDSIPNRWHPSQCILPSVIVFDPCNQHPNDVALPHCATCNQQCVTDWSHSKIRQIINSEPSILLQPTYVCPNNEFHDQGHKFYINPASNQFYCDENALPTFIANRYPFAITHKNVIATNVAHLLFNSHQTILSISKFEQLMRKQHHEFVEKKRLNLLMQMQSNDIQPATDWNDWSYNAVFKLQNRRRFFRDCILDEYNQKKPYWEYRKRQVTHDGVIFVDHTHKSAYRCKNRNGDRMFDAMYSIMNKEEIICQRLCISKQQQEIEDLHEYTESLNHVSRVLSDQCCADRPLVQRKHGADTTCKLDVFHALLRLSPHMPSTHHLYSISLSELKDVFYIKKNRVTQRTSNIPTLQASFASWCNM